MLFKKKKKSNKELNVFKLNNDQMAEVITHYLSDLYNYDTHSSKIKFFIDDGKVACTVALAPLNDDLSDQEEYRKIDLEQVFSEMNYTGAYKN